MSKKVRQSLLKDLDPVPVLALFTKTNKSLDYHLVCFLVSEFSRNVQTNMQTDISDDSADFLKMWKTPSGGVIPLKWTRLISYTHSHAWLASLVVKDWISVYQQLFDFWTLAADSFVYLGFKCQLCPHYVPGERYMRRHEATAYKSTRLSHWFFCPMLLFHFISGPSDASKTVQ